MSKNIAVVDQLTNSIKQVSREEWVVERNLGEARTQFDTPQFDRITSVSSFQLGFKVFYAICERCNRVQILSEGGKTLQFIHKSGLLPGEFEDPHHIAVHLTRANTEAAKKPTPEPSWYMGLGSREELEEEMEALEDRRPGVFSVMQRDTNEDIFDVRYITPGGKDSGITLLKTKASADAAQSVQLVMNDTNIRLLPRPSVWDAVDGFSGFVKAEQDPRPYVLLAVADSRRVQLLKYFWMSSELFIPSLQPFFDIGGPTKGCGCELHQPSGLAFSPSGEVAVSDLHTKRVYIISTVARCVVRTLDLSFISHIDIADNPSIYHRFPPARGREQRARAAAAQQKAYKDYLRNFDPRSKAKKKTLREFLGPAHVSTEDPAVVSLDFSGDGKLAMGYRQGGVLILKPYKIANVGLLTNMEHSSFNLVLAFCEYAEYEALRECCTSLHNYTARRRGEWLLSPLGGVRRQRIALAQFMQWSKLPAYATDRLKKSLRAPSPPPLSSTTMYWVPLLDAKKLTCCYNKWLHPEKNIHKSTKVVKVIKKQPKKVEVKSIYLRQREVVEYVDKQFAVFKDVEELPDRPMSETEVLCADPTCSLSHATPVYEPHYLKKFNAFIDKPCVLLAVSKLFGDVFLYKNETYVQHLFDAFSDEIEIETFHDPMSRKIEVIREKATAAEKCLSLEHFMQLMLICEEDFTGAKPFRRQFLFHRMRAQRKFLPPVTVPGPAMAVLEHGNLVNVIKDKQDFDSFLYANSIKQYRENINVPFKKNINKRYKKVNGAENDERGVNESEKDVYNHAFIIKANRAEAMIDKLFS